MTLAEVDLSGSDHEEGQAAGNSVESIWDDKTRQRVSEFAETVDRAKKARKAISDEVAAGKSKLIDDGFNKEALEAAVKYSRTEESERENFDLTYIYCRQALGMPIQDDLFGAAVQQQVVVTRQKPGDDE